jgi:hypothetical protein
LRALIPIIGRGNISAIKTPISFISLTPIQLRPTLIRKRNTSSKAITTF